MATQAEITWINQNQQLASQLGFSAQSPDGTVGQWVKGWYDQQGANAPKPDATDSAIFASTGIYPSNMQPGTAASVGNTSNTAQQLFGNDPTLNDNVNTALNKGATGATVNPNTQQVQGSSQSGNFQTTGATNTTGTQQQVGTTQQNQTTQGTQTGTNVQQQVGSTNQQNQGVTSSLSQPLDTLGLGQLIAANAGNAQRATDTSQGFLTDLVNNGPRNQQALTAQAVNQALSGPGMVGAGVGAQGRAAGNAAAQVGTNALNQQLQGAAQLSGPTALTTLANAGNPFIGQGNTTAQASNSQGTNVNNTAGTSTNNTTGSTSNVGLTSLLNKTNTGTTESQAGTSGANSAQVGVGQAPQQTTQSQGGCYVCTAYVQRGWLKATDVRRAAQWKVARPKYHRSLRGYSVYGPLMARWVLRSPIFATLFFPVARAILLAELDLVESRKSTWFSRTCHFIFHYGSLAVTVLTGQRKVKQCDTETSNLLVRHNLSFLCPF